MTEEKICCPRFDPKPWDEKEFSWENKKFIKDRVFTVFNIPLNFGSVMGRIMKKVDAAGRKSIDWICLSEHTSLWNMNIFVSVDREVPDAENVTLSGKFISKVYEGNFKETGNWMKDFKKFTESKNKKIKKMYMWYTTCPKCAKKYGKNYVVVVGEI